jgi:nucleoside-diphosphate-sugar epimerase
VSASLSFDTFGTPALTRVLVTGANGFVGRALCRALATRGADVVAVTRGPSTIAGATRVVPVGDLTEFDGWADLLEGVDGVAHLAALTHDGASHADTARFRAVNVDVSAKLVAAARRVRHFVYLSSIKVNGDGARDHATAAHGYSCADEPAPEDDYGRSKLAAERALANAWPRDGGALTILRPPLVYGPGQKGNLPNLMTLVAKRVPLPFAAIENRRSLIYVDNLVDAVCAALGIATPGVRCYTVADGALSTPQLVRALASGLGVQARLFSMPAGMMRALAMSPFIGGRLRRLTGSLLVDSGAARADLGWQPAVGFDAGFAATCADWRRTIQ